MILIAIKLRVTESIDFLWMAIGSRGGRSSCEDLPCFLWFNQRGEED